MMMSKSGDLLHDRVIAVAGYIIENNATVRQTAKEFGISKSTVHAEVTIQNDLEVRLCGQLNNVRNAAFPGLTSEIYEKYCKVKLYVIYS